MAGFTLIEVMVVMTVLALVAWVALPGFDRRHGVTAAMAARRLVGGLAEARLAATASGHPVAFVVDLAARRFGVPGARDQGEIPDDFSITLTTATDQLASATRGAITFFPDGGATGGRLRVDGRGDSATVTVDWLTGAARREP